MFLSLSAYKDIKISYDISENGYFSAAALDCLYTHNTFVSDYSINPGHGYPTFKEATDDIHDQIDIFLGKSIKGIEALAIEITHSLNKESYDDVMVNAQTLRLLLDRYTPEGD